MSRRPASEFHSQTRAFAYSAKDSHHCLPSAADIYAQLQSLAGQLCDEVCSDPH